MFRKKGPFEGYSVHQTRTGYVSSFWSRVQGHRDGLKLLRKFDAETPPDLDLQAMWNDTTRVGDYVAYMTLQSGTSKVLRKGRIVE